MNHPPIDTPQNPPADWLESLLEDFLSDTGPRQLDAASLRAAAESAEADPGYAGRLDAAALAATAGPLDSDDPSTAAILRTSPQLQRAGRSPVMRPWRLRVAAGAATAAAIAAGLAAIAAWKPSGHGAPTSDSGSPPVGANAAVAVAAVDDRATGSSRPADDRKTPSAGASAESLADVLRDRGPRRAVTEPLFAPDGGSDLTSPSVDSNARALPPADAASQWFAASSQLRAMINSQFEHLWNRLRLEPADAIDPVHWADRAHMRLTGLPLPGPAKERFRQTASTGGEEAKLQLLRSLLESDRFVEHWSRRLAEAHFDMDAADGPLRREAYDAAVAAIASAIRTDEPIARLWERFLALPVERAESLDDGSEAIADAGQTERGAWWLNHAGSPAPSRGQQLLRRWLGPQAACMNCHEADAGDTRLADAGGEQPTAWPLAATLNKFDVAVEMGGPAMRLTPGRELYYERTDGRVRMAAAGRVVPGIDRGVFSIRTAEQTPEAIVDAWRSWMLFARTSPRVGGQYIDVVWQGLFASPLVDPLSGPPGSRDAAHEELLDLRSLLASDSQLGGRSLRQLVEALVLSEVFARPELAVDTSLRREDAARLASFAAHRPPVSAEFRRPTAAIAWLRQNGLADDAPAEALAQPAYVPAATAARPVDRSVVDPAGRGWLILADEPPEAWRGWIEKLSDSKLDWPNVVDHSYYLMVGRAASPSEQATARDLLTISGSRERTLARLFASLAGV